MKKAQVQRSSTSRSAMVHTFGYSEPVDVSADGSDDVRRQPDIIVIGQISPLTKAPPKAKLPPKTKLPPMTTAASDSGGQHVIVGRGRD